MFITFWVSGQIAINGSRIEMKSEKLGEISIGSEIFDEIIWQNGKNKKRACREEICSGETDAIITVQSLLPFVTHSPWLLNVVGRCKRC